MSRGRKPKANDTNLSWQQIFSKNVGKYLQYAIIELGKVDNNQTESGADLLKKIKAEKGTTKKEKALPPIKAEEIPYKISENWAWCRLGEIIEFTDNLNIETKFSADTLINYVDIEAIDNQKHLIRESKLKPVSELSSRARRVLRKGYIVYSLVRPYLNNIAIVEDEKPNYIGSTGFAVFNGILVDNRFLKVFLLSEYVRELYLKMFSGFNSPSITQEQFASTLIPLPPLSEQQKIVDFLTDFENDNLKEDGYYFNQEVEQKVIALHEAQLKGFEIANELSYQLSLLKNLRQQLLQDAVQGKLVKNTEGGESAQDLLNKIKAEKEQLIKAKKLKKEKELPPIKAEEIPFDIPEDWVWCRLGEIAYITSGSTPSQDAFVEKGIPYLKMYNLRNQKIDFFYKPQYIKEEVHNGQLKRCRAYSGDVLMNIVGPPLGKIAIIPDDLPECNFNQAAVLIRPLFKDMNQFIFWYLNEMSEINSIDTKGVAGQNNISVTQAHNIKIALPPLTTQHRIVEKVSSLMQLCDDLEASIQTSARENEQLLQQVLREALQG